ncbi:MAG: hypothetical protein WC806_00700 [Candidatus Gracilibacteria bacterium]|jgi:hypothetical protein
MQNNTNTNSGNNTDAKEIRSPDILLSPSVGKQVQYDITPNEQKILGIFSDCGLLFEGILEKLNVDKSDELFVAILRNSLIRQAKDAVIISALKNADKNQLKKFKGFIKTNELQFPWESHEMAIFELLLSDEKLKQKAFADLNEFFKNFIERFNRFSEI